MPGYRGHAWGAAAVAALVVAGYMAMHALSWMVINDLLWIFVGALFPDSDTASKGRRLFALILIPGGIIAYLLGHLILAAVCAAVIILLVFVKHRTLFHNLWFLAGLTALFVVCLVYAIPEITWPVVRSGIFFLLGAWSHLVLDRGFSRSFASR